jgi:hypothetical protein
MTAVDLGMELRRWLQALGGDPRLAKCEDALHVDEIVVPSQPSHPLLPPATTQAFKEDCTTPPSSMVTSSVNARIKNDASVSLSSLSCTEAVELLIVLGCNEDPHQCVQALNADLDIDGALLAELDDVNVLMELEQTQSALRKTPLKKVLKKAPDVQMKEVPIEQYMVVKTRLESLSTETDQSTRNDNAGDQNYNAVIIGDELPTTNDFNSSSPISSTLHQTTLSKMQCAKEHDMQIPNRASVTIKETYRN